MNKDEVAPSATCRSTNRVLPVAKGFDDSRTELGVVEFSRLLGRARAAKL